MEDHVGTKWGPGGVPHRVWGTVGGVPHRLWGTGRWGTPPGLVFKKSWFSLLGLKPTKTQKCWFFIGFIRKNGGPSWDQVGPKSKNVDISLVLQGFLKYHWSTKSKNIDFSLVFKGKTRRGHRASIAPGRGRHSWRGPPVSLWASLKPTRTLTVYHC